MLDLEKLRKLVIMALFTDNELYDTFVLKGGNALMAHAINDRSSTDVDVSMPDEFNDDELNDIKNRLEKALESTFNKEQYSVIDVELKKSPRDMSNEKKMFWGGYTLSFKIVSQENKTKFKDNIQSMRQSAEVIDNQQSKKFTVDISKFEYCEPKTEILLDGFPIYVYTPLMIVYEKIRAICQQNEEYGQIVQTNRKPRARDFYDICSILNYDQSLKKKITEKNNLKDLEEIFKAKKVPLEFINKIQHYREYHRENFISVEDTVSPNVKLESYDFYFDQVIRICNEISESIFS